MIPPVSGGSGSDSGGGPRERLRILELQAEPFGSAIFAELSERLTASTRAAEEHSTRTRDLETERDELVERLTAAVSAQDAEDLRNRLREALTAETASRERSADSGREAARHRPGRRRRSSPR